jgi:hypothetical protein
MEKRRNIKNIQGNNRQSLLMIPLLLCGLLFAAACRKEAKIKLPKPESKLVVTCFISPEDSLISAVVRISVPKFAPKDTTVTYVDDVRDADISLTDGQNTVLLKFDGSLLFYMAPASEFPIVPGKSYTLSVSTPDGKSTTAVTVVPDDRPEIKSLNAIILRSDSVSLEYETSVTVPDLPGQPTYMALHTQQLVISSRSMGTPFGYPDFTSSTDFKTDETIATPEYFFNGQSFIQRSDTIRSVDLDVVALNCSREFYLYNKSVPENSFGGNPFAEPSLVFSNMSNGFGCFGAYRSQKTRVRIR